MVINVGARPATKHQSLGGAKAKGTKSGSRKKVVAPTRDRRMQIVQAALGLFAEYGFEKTSVRQIADQVEILSGSLYHHFVSKEEILHEVIRDTIDQIGTHDSLISNLAVDAEHKLLASVLLRFHKYITSWEVHAVLLQDSQFFYRTREFSYVGQAKLRSFQAHEAILKEGMKTGLFHRGIDTYLMIGTITRILTSAAQWYRRGDIYMADKPSSYTIGKVVDFHLDSILRMVRPPSRLSDAIPRQVCERLVDLPPPAKWETATAR